MSYTDSDSAMWGAADHAEVAIKKLLPRVRKLQSLAITHDDAEAMNAIAHGLTNYQASVLWQRRNLREHGGRMRTPPGEDALVEREAIRTTILDMLGKPSLTPALFAHGTGVLGSLMFAEFDGTMQPGRDIAILEVVHRSWKGLGKTTADGGAPYILRYLANTAISVTSSRVEDAAYEAANLLSAMTNEIDLTPDQVTDKIADSLADLVGALLYYESEYPRRGYSGPSSWTFLKAADWRARMVERLSFAKLLKLTIWAVLMLRATDNEETVIAWSWLIERLTSEPPSLGNDVDWFDVGGALLEALRDKDLPPAEAGRLISALQTRIQAEAQVALIPFSERLNNFAFDLPTERELNAHDSEFVLRTLELGLSDPEAVSPCIVAIVSLLVQYALHGDWQTVDRAIVQLMADEPDLGWAKRIIVYRTIVELALVSEVSQRRVDAYVQALATPFADTDRDSQSEAVEDARRSAIDSLLSRHELNVHPTVFFPLIGLTGDE